MLAVAQKMFPNPFYVVQLHIFWMFDKEFGFAFVIGKNNSIIFENGKIDFSFTTSNFYNIFAFMASKIPVAVSRDTRFVKPASGDGILGRIQSLLVQTLTRNLLDVSQKEGEQVQSVTGQIIKITSRSYFCIGAPIVFSRQILG